MLEHAPFLLLNVLSELRSVSPQRHHPCGDMKRVVLGPAGSTEAKPPPPVCVHPPEFEHIEAPDGPWEGYF